MLALEAYWPVPDMATTTSARIYGIDIVYRLSTLRVKAYIL